MKSIIYSVLFLIVGTIALSSCTGNTVKESTGRMRIINASYLSGGINIDVDYKPVYATITEYLNYSLYRDYIAGKRKLQIKNAAGNVIIDTAITIVQSESYTVVAYDSMNTILCKIFKENYLTPKGSTCKVRFLHLSNDAPTVNIHKDGDLIPTFDNYSNGEYSEYFTYGIGATYFSVKDSATGSTIYTQSPFAMEAGYFYTMYLKGNTTSTGIDSLGLFVISNNGEY